jgi:hypothetical protein
MPTPFEIIAAPVIVYQAAIGEAFPLIDAAVAGNWVKIGTSGDRNIPEDGVTVAHSQEVEPFYSIGGTGPQKVFRTREGFVCRFTLADLTLEEYSHILNDNSVTDTAASSGVAGIREVDLYRGSEVSQVALLIRGLFSAYGDTWNTQFQIPNCYQTGTPEPVFMKGTPAALAFEYTAIEDPLAATSADRFGKLVMQDAAPT